MRRVLAALLVLVALQPVCATALAQTLTLEDLGISLDLPKADRKCFAKLGKATQTYALSVIKAVNQCEKARDLGKIGVALCRTNNSDDLNLYDKTAAKRQKAEAKLTAAVEKACTDDQISSIHGILDQLLGPEFPYICRYSTTVPAILHCTIADIAISLSDQYVGSVGHFVRRWSHALNSTPNLEHSTKEMRSCKQTIAFTATKMLATLLKENQKCVGALVAKGECDPSKAGPRLAKARRKFDKKVQLKCDPNLAEVDLSQLQFQDLYGNAFTPTNDPVGRDALGSHVRTLAYDFVDQVMFYFPLTEHLPVP